MGTWLFKGWLLVGATCLVANPLLLLVWLPLGLAVIALWSLFTL